MSRSFGGGGHVWRSKGDDDRAVRPTRTLNQWFESFLASRLPEHETTLGDASEVVLIRRSADRQRYLVHPALVPVAAGAGLGTDRELGRVVDATDRRGRRVALTVDDERYLCRVLLARDRVPLAVGQARAA